jgi:hypothetical protein
MKPELTVDELVKAMLLFSQPFAEENAATGNGLTITERVVVFVHPLVVVVVSETEYIPADA